MKNFHFLLTAWIAVWAVFFAYETFGGQPHFPLRREIERLKQQLREG